MSTFKLEKDCTTCKFNFDGICADGNPYGKKIENIVINCEYWEDSLDYFNVIMKEIPWYIKEPFDNCKISYRELLEYIDKDYKREPFDINLYRLIEEILNIDTFKLADILGVKVTVIGYAMRRGTPSKRTEEFSIKLGLPSKYFRKTTNLDIDDIKQILLDNNTLIHKK
ncbi:TPA: hypothetical protein ACOTHR_001738 [Clostridium perfringens]